MGSVSDEKSTWRWVNGGSCLPGYFSYGDPNKRSIFVLNEDKKDGVTGSGSGQIKNYGGALRLIPNRWYEQYAQGGG